MKQGLFPHLRLLFLSAVLVGYIGADALLAQVIPPVVIADSSFDDFWVVEDSSQFGASQTHSEEFSGGNPGAYRKMEHILPAPPGPSDLAIIEVSHIYKDPLGTYSPFSDGEIDYIDYSEDMVLLSLPWDQAFIRSFLLISQDGVLFRSAGYSQIIAQTSWVTQSLNGLQADNFVALDGSVAKPDFSEAGSTLEFGYFRLSSRFRDLPVPASQTLVYEHGIDNWTVTIQRTAGANRAPSAESDAYLYVDFTFGAPMRLPVLQNDSDPDGHPIRIVKVTDPVFDGSITAWDDSLIFYANDMQDPDQDDAFIYSITDEIDSSGATVTIYTCGCPIQCLVLSLPPRGVQAGDGGTLVDAQFLSPERDTLDVDLFRDFRDGYLHSTARGSSYVQIYYDNAPELMDLVVLGTEDLRLQAISVVELMQDPIRNLVEGDGSAVISQTLVDTISAFFDSLSAAASPSLGTIIATELARLGPLQDFVGLPVDDAVDRAISDSVAVGVENTDLTSPRDLLLSQNFPNPFNLSTQIRYHVAKTAYVNITIYNIQGRKVRSLVTDVQTAGTKSITWDGLDDRGVEVTSGVYFYRLAADGYQETKKMILMK